MDSAALSSLTPLLDGVDQWAELLPLLPVLVALELVLSADNAIALAAVARKQNDPIKEKKALDLGIAIAFFLRVALILLAQWVLAFKPLQLIAGFYLLWLFLSHIWVKPSGSQDRSGSSEHPPSTSFTRTIVALALTDLAFSVDSVAAAVAISDQLILVITGAFIGVVALRFTSGLFIRWLQIYTRLETAGYLAVALVGVKLILTLALPGLQPPEWWTLLTVALLMIWGFSERKETLGHEV
ncbi:membrane protein [Synechococcus sp. CC9311]|uniref:TerC family protein n=1 Tax=Synechococcus sp. (strain CC9311) TaxID=64471 RepID=UPI0000DDADFE|nr:membrane protein [Synechococcus sp. CC9311]ABI45694.1 membrane protein, TerC family protein [Synechococcus sp. CC9311]